MVRDRQLAVLTAFEPPYPSRDRLANSLTLNRLLHRAMGKSGSSLSDASRLYVKDWRSSLSEKECPTNASSVTMARVVSGLQDSLILRRK